MSGETGIDQRVLRECKLDILIINSTMTLEKIIRARLIGWREEFIQEIIKGGYKFVLDTYDKILNDLETDNVFLSIEYENDILIREVAQVILQEEFDIDFFREIEKRDYILKQLIIDNPENKDKLSYDYFLKDKWWEFGLEPKGLTPVSEIE